MSKQHLGIWMEVGDYTRRRPFSPFYVSYTLILYFIADYFACHDAFQLAPTLNWPVNQQAYPLPT